jgi:hypothetical protein
MQRAEEGDLALFGDRKALSIIESDAAKDASGDRLRIYRDKLKKLYD